jgi:hypothetical protein
MVEGRIQVRVTHVQHAAPAPAAPLRLRVCLFAPSVTVCTVLCVRVMTFVSHERLLRRDVAVRDVAVLHFHARMGESEQHGAQWCWPQRKILSRHDFGRPGPVGAWWVDNRFR